MVKKFLICLVFLFVISNVLAVEGLYEPTVSVRGQVGDTLVVRIKNLDTEAYIVSQIVEIDSGASANFQFSTEADEVQISILYIKNVSEFLKSTNIVKTIERGVFSTHGVINLNLQTMSFNEVTPPESEVEPEENETIAEPEPEIIVEPELEPEIEDNIEDSSKKNDGISGFSIFINDNGSISTFTYIAAGVILLAGIVFVVLKILRKKMGSRRWASDDNELSDVEAKINSAGKEIKEIKERKKRLNEAERRLREDEEELRRLRE